MLHENEMNKKIIDCFQILETVLPNMHQIVQIYAVPGAQEVDIYSAVSARGPVPNKGCRIERSFAFLQHVNQVHIRYLSCNEVLGGPRELCFPDVYISEIFQKYMEVQTFKSDLLEGGCATLCAKATQTRNWTYKTLLYKALRFILKNRHDNGKLM